MDEYELEYQLSVQLYKFDSADLANMAKNDLKEEGH